MKPVQSTCPRLVPFLMALVATFCCSQPQIIASQRYSSFSNGNPEGPLEFQSSSRVPESNWMRYRNVEQAGFSPDAINRIRRELSESGIDGLLVVCGGAVILRHGDVETRFMCHSVRKSFMSMLFGIYVEQGKIDLSKTLAELNIDDIDPALSAKEKQATIKDLLKSRSGVYHRSAYEPGHMKQSRPKRGSHQPGSHWWYNNWDFNVLLTIFEQETGEKFFEAFEKQIAVPLQLQDFRLRDGYYHREPNNSMHPAYPFRLSGRDMARIGLLMAQRGRWGKQQVVPSEWVQESTRPHSVIKKWNRYDGYGYMWWTARIADQSIFSALGNGNNSIDVIPNRNLVLVFRANTYQGKSIPHAVRWKIIRQLLLAQTESPTKKPDLVVLNRNTNPPAAATLTADYRDQFPLELRRQLPKTLPAEIRNRPVRIEDVDGTLVLYTAPPPALQFDLIPLAPDRFFIEGPNQLGAIDRDQNGQPRRFLLRNDLVTHIAQLKKEGQLKQADSESKTLQQLFGETTGKNDPSARPEKYQSNRDKVMMKNVYVMTKNGRLRNASPTPGEGFYGAGCVHPDGNDVIFAGAARGLSRIWKYDIATEKVTSLTPTSSVSISPSYSSDGKQIVFVSDRDFHHERFDMFEVGRNRPHNDGFKGGMTSSSSLYIMDADGSNVRRLTRGDHFDLRPSFSPDGHTIVFLSSRGANTLHIWTVPTDGSEPPTKLNIDDNPWAGRPRYSRNGKHLFFFTGIENGHYQPRGRHTICRVSADGGAWEAIENDTLGDSSHGPDPDPDGEHLWYHAALKQQWRLLRLNLSGGKPQIVTPPSFEKHHVAHPTIATNGVLCFDSRSFLPTKD